MDENEIRVIDFERQKDRGGALSRKPLLPTGVMSEKI